jgi:hypothetical protein
MIELKQKIVKYLLINGKKFTNEKKVITSFKKLNISYKKKVKNILQLLIHWSSFIFKYNTKVNSSYFFVYKERIFFAIKQIVKFNFFENLDVFNKELQVQKKLQSILVANKKLLHFYRWNNK